MKGRIRVRRDRPESLTSQVTNQLASLIDSGLMAAGSLLPSERQLSDTLGVARNVVRRSYQVLTNRGYLSAEGRKARRVSSKKSRKPAASAKKGSPRKKSSPKSSPTRTRKSR